MCVCVNTCCAFVVVHGGQRRHLHKPKLELQVVVSPLTQVLGTKPGSSEEWKMLLIEDLSLQPPNYIFIGEQNKSEQSKISQTLDICL